MWLGQLRNGIPHLISFEFKIATWASGHRSGQLGPGAFAKFAALSRGHQQARTGHVLGPALSSFHVEDTVNPYIYSSYKNEVISEKVKVCRLIPTRTR